MTIQTKLNACRLVIFASVALSVPASAATQTLFSNLDNSFTIGTSQPGSPPVFSNTVEAPFVGSLTLSYDAESALANGTYSWNSLSNLSLNVSFPNAGTAGVTFNQSHLDFDPLNIRIQVVDGNFFFTNTNGSGVSLAGNSVGGSANFINGNYLFTTQPLNSDTRTGFGGYVVDYNALYQLVDITTASVGIAPGQPGYSGGTPIYMGNYGNPTANASAATIPEPSAAMLGSLGALALLRRKRAQKTT
jgi:hypothetical protein